MKCPFCGGESRVIESRPAADEEAVRRRRECLACGRRFTTMERVEVPPLIVVKKDGRRERFNRDKLLSGILKACEKRPVPMEVIEKLADDIERDLRSSLDQEVPTSVIGERVMEALRQIDGVAYVRFASVYREFKDLNEFREQLEQLLKSR